MTYHESPNGKYVGSERAIAKPQSFLRRHWFDISFGTAMACLLIALVLFFCFGCEKNTKSISDSANRVNTLALNSEQRADEIIGFIESATQPDTAAIRTNASEIKTDQQEIQRHAGNIQHRIPSIQDREGVFDKLLGLMKIWGTVLLIGAFIALLMYLGVGPIIRRFFNSLGMFIPKAKLNEAKLDLDAADEKDPTTIREAMAFKRAKDPQYDAAIRKIKKGVI